MNVIKIAITADHAGFFLKEDLVKFLINEGHDIKDLGTYSDESVDYPELGHAIARIVLNNEITFGISICGSGNGINITANKYNGIRSALCWSKETARLARAHNDANICALPGRFINTETGIVIVKTFLETKFEGGRHERRIKKIPIIS